MAMLNRMLLLAGAASVVAASAIAAPSDYRVEGLSAEAGASSELTVRILHVPSNTYVPNARVWHVEKHQSFKGPAPYAETRRALRPDGQGGYRLSLPLHVHGNSLEQVVASVPTEGSPIVASVGASARR